MKKNYSIFCLIVFLSLLFISCSVEEDYQFLCSPEDIISISVVSLSDENGEIVQNELNVIDNLDAFLNDFQSIHCRGVYGGSPSGVIIENSREVVIKILYSNDEYEFINWRGQAKYTQEKGFRFYAGFYVFDQEEFKALIEKYSQ